MQKKCSMILLALLCAGVAVFQSCRKDSAGSVEKSEVQKGNETGWISQDDAEHRVLAFQQKCAFMTSGPGVKSSELVYYKEALWLLEASLNYTFGFTMEATSESRVDSCVFLLPANGIDSVTYQGLATCYNRLTDSITGFYNQVLWNEKHIMVTDVVLTPSPQDNAFLVSMKLVTGKTMEEPGDFDNPYRDDDYWFYGGLAGKCGPYYPAAFGTDASKMIQKYQDWFKPVYPLGPGCHVFYSDIEVKTVLGNKYLNPSDPNPCDNLLDYLMYYSVFGQPNDHDCLDPSEMWFYLNGLFHVVNDADKERGTTNPPLKDFVSLVLTPVALANSTKLHQVSITYGIPHISCDPQFPVKPNLF